MKIHKIEPGIFYFDAALRRCDKLSPPGTPDKNKRRKIFVKEKMKTVYVYLDNTLDRIIKNFPEFDELSSFYKELIIIDIGRQNYEEAISSIKWLRNKLKKLYREYRENLKLSEYFGRVKSLMKKFKNRFTELDSMREKINKFPLIKNYPTVLVSGFPNVGKTSLLKCLTGRKAKIRSYSFTTKKIIVGVIKENNMHIQIVDTPGLLDRPYEERNIIEKKAITSLKHLSKLILYLFDPSMSCGYVLEEQENLYKRIKESFPDKKIIRICNKSDLNKEVEADFYISCKTREGIEEIKKYLHNFFQNSDNISLK